LIVVKKPFDTLKFVFQKNHPNAIKTPQTTAKKNLKIPQYSKLFSCSSSSNPPTALLLHHFYLIIIFT
jgi:hypothetical protein